MGISETNFLSVGLLVLAIHFFLYLVALRRRLRSEAAIFLYHLLPTVTLCVLFSDICIDFDDRGANCFCNYVD